MVDKKTDQLWQTRKKETAATTAWKYAKPIHEMECFEKHHVNIDHLKWHCVFSLSICAAKTNKKLAFKLKTR